MAGISLETRRQIEMILQPLAMRQRNMIARAQVLLVDDGPGLQSLQVAAPETVPDGEHYQPYGFSSVPLEGAEGVALFPSGDRGHPLIIVMSDRRYRPTGGEPGEVTVYNNTGASITITKDGDIRARAAPGRDVLIDDGGGSTEPVVKRSEFLSHGHAIVATGAVSPCAGPVAGALPAGSSTTFPGTATLQVK